jgi:hypothetical protein
MWIGRSWFDARRRCQFIVVPNNFNSRRCRREAASASSRLKRPDFTVVDFKPAGANALKAIGDCTAAKAHSAEAVAHMINFCIGDLVETPITLP